jgi:hypothetical protein
MYKLLAKVTLATILLSTNLLVSAARGQSRPSPSPVTLPSPPSAPRTPTGNRPPARSVPPDIDIRSYIPNGQPDQPPTSSGFPTFNNGFGAPPPGQNSGPLSTFRTNFPQTVSPGALPNGNVQTMTFPQPFIGGLGISPSSMQFPQPISQYQSSPNFQFGSGNFQQSYTFPESPLYSGNLENYNYTINLDTRLSGSMNPNGGGFNRVVSIGQDWLPVIQNGLNGGGFSGMLNSAAPKLQGLLGKQLSLSPANLQTIQSVLPLAQQLMGGDFRGALSGSLPLLSRFLPENVGNILGAVGPLAGQLFSGNFNAGSLLSAGSSLLQLFGKNNSMLGPISGVLGSLGGLFGGGGGTGVSVASTLSPVFQFGGGQTQINAALMGGGNPGSVGTSSVMSQTGTVLCRYNPSGCVTSNPVAYQSLYGSAIGAMGFSNPNQVRGQIAQLSRSGVRPDAYSSRNTSEQNSYFMGNSSDRELIRARTEASLSVEAQEIKQQAITAAKQAGAQLLQLGDNCSQTSQSTQELSRCNLQTTATLPSLAAAQLELGHFQQVDDANTQLLLGNISSAVDGESRVRTMEYTSIANTLKRNVTLNIQPRSRP